MALVHDFVTQLKSTFPVVLIDEQHNNIDSLGYHHRGEWSDHFDIRMQFIHVNASVSKIFLGIFWTSRIPTTTQYNDL